MIQIEWIWKKDRIWPTSPSLSLSILPEAFPKWIDSMAINWLIRLAKIKTHQYEDQWEVAEWAAKIERSQYPTHQLLGLSWHFYMSIRVLDTTRSVHRGLDNPHPAQTHYQNPQSKLSTAIHFDWMSWCVHSRNYVASHRHAQYPLSAAPTTDPHIEPGQIE